MSCASLFVLLAVFASPVSAGSIPVRNPLLLGPGPIACERIALGQPDDYKPCVARLPGGELLLIAFHPYELGGGKIREPELLFRSRDGGRTWSQPETLPLLGREPYLTALPDGTLFLTGHLLAADVRNRWGYTCGFPHRSTDGGHTWQSIRFESEGIRPGETNYSSRNVLRLADGTLLLGVDYRNGPHFMWRSHDEGRTWDKTSSMRAPPFPARRTDSSAGRPGFGRPGPARSGR